MLIDPRFQPFIGLPYGEAARGGVAGWDCWGLVLKIYREVLGIELPRYEGVTVADEPDVERSLARDRITNDWRVVAERPDGEPRAPIRYLLRPQLFDVAYFSLLRRPHVGVIASSTGLYMVHTHAPSSDVGFAPGPDPASYATRIDASPWRQTMIGIYRHPEVTA